MSVYTPFQLVHAHLPLLPTAPGPVAEVSVPSERPFSYTDEVYTSPLHPDHAVSAAFDSRTATLARTVYNGYALELRSLSPILNKGKSVQDPTIIRILFPDQLRPLEDGCVIPSFGSRELVVIVLSTENIIYRFTFPLGLFVDRGDRIQFTPREDEWVEQWQIDADLIASAGGIGSWAVADEDTVALGCADGGIIRVVRDADSKPELPFWVESHHRGTSRLRFFSRAADELITSIAQFNYEDHFSVLYTYSRDSKLRTWSSMTGNCLKSVDVRIGDGQQQLTNSQRSVSSPRTPMLPTDTSASAIRVVAHPNPSSRCSHVVVVFVPSPYDPTVPGTFVFYRASSTPHGVNDLEFAGVRPGSLELAGSQLRGFDIVPPTRTDAVDGWRLWAVWDLKGSLAAESIQVNDILQFTTYLEPQVRPAMVFDWQQAVLDNPTKRFDNTYFDNLIDLEAADPMNPHDNEDITIQFISHLFTPGRFSTLTLTTALDDYIDQLPPANQVKLETSVYPSLSSRFRAAVGSALKMEVSTQTGAPEVVRFRKDLKQQWQGVWARVRELDKQARWPVATATVNGQLLILDRDGASAPVEEDTPGVLVQLGKSTDQATEFQSLPEGSLRVTYPGLAPPQSRRALTALAVAGEGLSAILDSNEVETSTGSALDALIDTLDGELASGFQEPVEVIGSRLWEGVEPFVGENERSSLDRALAESTSVARTLSDALDILASTPEAASSDKMTENAVFSGFGNALLTSTITAIIASRFAFARDILLVGLYHLSLSEEEVDDDFIEVLARTFVSYHRYRVLQWLAEQTGEDAVERTRARRIAKRLRGKDDLFADFDALKMREGDDEMADVDGYSTAYSLLHSLLARVLQGDVSVGVDTVAGLFDTACAFLAELDVLHAGQTDVEPTANDIRLAYAVLADGHSTAARDMTELYPLSSGLAFVRGRALLEVGEIEEGVRHLELAAVGVRDGSLACILPTCTGTKGLGEYYRRIMAVVDEHGLEAPVARFGNLALQTIENGDPSTRDIWTRVFLAFITLGQYEDAYATLTTAPFHDIKRDLLGQLISAMCEANEVGRLVSLGFIGFQRDVEERLNFKARNSDPLRTPNYYKVLYSWHISRGDYRSAGEIMYAQGQRFAEASSAKASHYELSAMRAQSYLAAINALSLVEKRNAWISVNVNPEAIRSQKRRKVTTYIPEDEFSPDVQAVNIITLQDMRAEYTAVLSQLRLSQHIQNLHAHGVSLSPDEVVGFFTQRSMFDEAQSSAATMGVDMTDLFTVLATRCVELARAPGVKLDNPSAAFLSLSPVTSRLRGPPAALALRYLQVALARHDSAATHWRYRVAVGDAFLRLNDDMRSGWQVPPWLVEAEMARDPEGWISRALAAGWVAEALGWAADMLRRQPAPDLVPRKPEAVDGAYNLVDRVLAAAGSEPETREAAETLRAEVKRRVAGLKKRDP